VRILLVAGAFPPTPCGVGDYTARLAEALASDGATEVAVLTKEESVSEQLNHVMVLPVVKDWSLSDMRGIMRVVRAWRPDFVHIQYPSQGFYGRPLTGFLPLFFLIMGVRSVVTWHEPYGWRGLISPIMMCVAAKGLIFVRPNYLNLVPNAFRWLVKACRWKVISNAEAIPVSRLTPDDRLMLKAQYLEGRERLIVYFGFIYPKKGVDQLFDIANSETDKVVIAGATPDMVYLGKVRGLANTGHWEGHVHFAGFLDAVDAADLLAVADAVVLPFMDGGGEWNTSIHSALAQGTLVITTSIAPKGDEPDRNLFTASIGAVGDMRIALNGLAGRKVVPNYGQSKWEEIAAKHIEFYKQLG
jgi:glycosyltransferase involved in cell wall biosynthesis